jgi:hypothetical protein
MLPELGSDKNKRFLAFDLEDGVQTSGLAFWLA